MSVQAKAALLDEARESLRKSFVDAEHRYGGDVAIAAWFQALCFSAQSFGVTKEQLLVVIGQAWDIMSSTQAGRN